MIIENITADRTSAPLHNLRPAMASPMKNMKCSHHHFTWARTFHSRPEQYIQPESVEEVQEITNHARKCRRRVVVVGSAHSPSHLTCTSSWLVNLDKLNKILQIKHDDKTGEDTAVVQAGISLAKLNTQMSESPHQMIMPNLGSINEQSMAGALATATHGSSIYHAPMTQSVRALRVVLSDGKAVWCSPQDRPSLFRAALVSLGAIGIVVEVEYCMVPSTNIEWDQTLSPLQEIIDDWDKGLWTQAEFVRCWWLPYKQQIVVWKADKTSKGKRLPESSGYGGFIGRHLFKFLLWTSKFFPSIVPTIERFIFGLQMGFNAGPISRGVEEQHKGLLMDCLMSQFVNEWAMPLHKGPEAITRLSKWLNGDEDGAKIPFSSRGLYVHCPIEVRVSDGAIASEPQRGYLDPTSTNGPTLYLNATLFRPYYSDPPCRARYYEAFEWLMKELGGRPHWAKNFTTVSNKDIQDMYGQRLDDYLTVRNEVDPDGMFVGAWHRQMLLGEETLPLPLEEVEDACEPRTLRGGMHWSGRQREEAGPMEQTEREAGVRSSKSMESFDSFGTSTESGEEISRSEALNNGDNA